MTEILRGQAGFHPRPGLVAQRLGVAAQGAEVAAPSSIVKRGRRHGPEIVEKDIQVAGRRQLGRDRLGAAAQIPEPVLLKGLAESPQHHFQPPQRHPQMMQRLDRAPGAQHPGLGRSRAQAIGQGWRGKPRRRAACGSASASPACRWRRRAAGAGCRDWGGRWNGGRR